MSFSEGPSFETKHYNEGLDNRQEKERKDEDYSKKNTLIKEIKEKADKLHYLDQVEADLYLKISLNPDKFINEIETKQEFFILFEKLGDVTMIGYVDEYIMEYENPEKILKMKERIISDPLGKELYKLYKENPEKMKDFYIILEGLNYEGLQNFFNNPKVKDLPMEEKIKKLGRYLKSLKKELPHMPDTMAKYLSAIEKYYDI